MAEDGGVAAAALTPMIDVVFLLMIFFLFGTIPLGERQILAAIAAAPAASPAAAGGPCRVVLRTDGGLRYQVDGGAWVESFATLEGQIADRLRHPDCDGYVTVDAQAGVAFQHVVDVFSAAQRCGALGVSMKSD